MVILVYDFGEEVGDVEVLWMNLEVMYVVIFLIYWGVKKIYCSSNGGISWMNIIFGVMVSSGVFYDIEVSYNDFNVIWVVCIGCSIGSNNKIMCFINGGSSWMDIIGSIFSDEVFINVII